MEKRILKLGLVVGIIMLFIGTCCVPTNAKQVDDINFFPDKNYLIIGRITNMSYDENMGLYRFECVLTYYIDQHGINEFTNGRSELKPNYLGMLRPNFIFCIGEANLPS